MENEIVTITEEQVCLIADERIDDGQEIYIEIKLPSEIMLESFNIIGTVLSCKYMHGGDDDRYLLNLKIGELYGENKLIFMAYLDYKKREEVLNDLNLNDEALQRAIERLGGNLKQLVGAIELMQGDITVH